MTKNHDLETSTLSGRGASALTLALLLAIHTGIAGAATPSPTLGTAPNPAVDGI